MLIGELSERTGASRRSIRHYEQQGLLTARRTSKGWREYDEQAVHRVLNVRELLRAGLVVDDIRHVAPCLDMKTAEFLACDRPLAGSVEMYQRRLAQVDAQAAELSRYRAELAARLARLRATTADTDDFAESLRSNA
ncbi:MerR family transcriptional regulator [Plantactinospora sp. GCM10030261]|uniref:MerR family transcriptional regulator n=1 Tax=Plantactinospora sp. GCM10030261 TaxID=3273420 RepID=UPI0036200AF3